MVISRVIRNYEFCFQFWLMFLIKTLCSRTYVFPTKPVSYFNYHKRVLACEDKNIWIKKKILIN